MRASHMLSNVESLDTLGPPDAEAIRERCREAIAEIESAVRTAWLPLWLDVELTRGVEHVCGRERMLRWSRDAIARSADGPLLRPFMQGLRALGLNPHASLRLAPRAWDAVYRHCGALTYERVSEREAALVQRDAPALIVDVQTYQYGIAGGFEGAMELAGGEGCEVIPHADVARGEVRYVGTWS